MLPIRRATLADLPALHALIERSYRGATARRGWTHEADLLAGQRTTATALAGIIGGPAQAMLVATDAAAIVACVQLTDNGGGTAYLGQLAVDPARQAAGLGRAMIAAAEAAARDFGATTIEMTVINRRVELIAYYARRGYAPTGEIRPFPFDQPIDGLPIALVVLAKAL